MKDKLKNGINYLNPISSDLDKNEFSTATGEGEILPLLSISKEDFLSLSSAEISRLVRQKNDDLTGIFLADGNRRLVMALTGKTPGSQGFYEAYSEIAISRFMQNLEVFFSHGIRRLFFPIFGNSILERDKEFLQSVIPSLINSLFQDSAWLRFYNQYNIRVEFYGSPGKLDGVFPHLGLSGKIGEMKNQTSGNTAHILYYGFFSDSCLDQVFSRHILRFIDEKGKEPNRDELTRIYYGEYVPQADFFINSTRAAGLGALPPLAYGKNTRIYTTAAPGIFAVDSSLIREILYDLLIESSLLNSSSEANSLTQHDLDNLKDFYFSNRHVFTGRTRKIGRFQVLDI